MSGILDAKMHDTRALGRSFVWSNLLYRACWNTVWLLFAAWTPPQLHGWRRLLLRLFGAKIGPGARIYGSARIWYPPNLEMAEGAVLGRSVDCCSMAKITIGRFATVSQYAQIITGSHAIDDPNFQLTATPIRIGAHAWIAAGAFVGPGVTVGEGAVLGARGVAFGDLAPWSVHIGNPARFLKERRFGGRAEVMC